MIKETVIATDMVACPEMTMVGLPGDISQELWAVDPCFGGVVSQPQTGNISTNNPADLSPSHLYCKIIVSPQRNRHFVCQT